MRVVNLQRINQKKPNLTKAVFDIDFGVMVVPDFKLIQGANGKLWAAVPRKDNGREPVVRVKSEEIMEVITQAAREVYESRGREGVERELKR